MDYPHINIRFKYYGKHIELLVAKTIHETNQETQKQLSIHIARLMKNFYLEWNQENISDEMLSQHLGILSDNKLTLDIQDEQTLSLLKLTRKESTQPHRRKSNQGPRRYNNSNSVSSKRPGNRRKKPA